MKKTLVGILILALCIAVISCSNDPNPKIRVRNERKDNVNVKIHTSTKNEISINDVEPGQTSEYQTASEGNITAIAVIQNESISFNAVKDARYTIIISPDKAPSMQIDK